MKKRYVQKMLTMVLTAAMICSSVPVAAETVSENETAVTVDTAAKQETAEKPELEADEEAQPEEAQPEAPVEPDQGAAVEEAAEPAEIMLAPTAVAPAASQEWIKEIELNLKPVTEIKTLADFQSITFSPSCSTTYALAMPE